MMVAGSVGTMISTGMPFRRPTGEAIPVKKAAPQQSAFRKKKSSRGSAARGRPKGMKWIGGKWVYFRTA
jgi:hypothetical protein